MERKHLPVLFNEVLDLVRPARKDGTIVDATIGLGGHSEGLLEKYPEARLIGVDRDSRALEIARERLGRFGTRVTLVEGRHESIIDILRAQNIDTIDALLADLGVSSLQFDDPSRGFSFRFESPLDMRMGAEGTTAADLVNSLDEAELAKILRDYGEEPRAGRIARAIVASRGEGRIETTSQLARVVRDAKKGSREKIDPATLTFQALRIATNEELVGLNRFVDDAVSVLKAGGGIGVISFHSLEDRIIKRAFRRLEGECVCPPALPVCGCGAREIVRIVTKRPVEASEEEVDRNPRSRSAKLRVARKS